MDRKVTFASLFVVLLAFVLVSGTPNRAEAADQVLRIKISKAEQQAALAFWTRERIASATPMDLMVDNGSPEVDAAALGQPEAGGEPGIVPAGLSAPGADRVAKAAYPADWANLKDGGSGAPEAVSGTPGVFTSYIVNQWKKAQKVFPHKWVGRVSYTVPGGTGFCSATSISNNVMLTAAHCVYDSTNNRFFSNWVFTPAYRNGSAPYGVFPATTCWVLTAWVNLSGGFAINTWSRHDVAVCNMGANSAGQTLNQAVGWSGRQWNWPYVRHFNTLGYPFRNTSNATLTDAGKWLRTCAAESFQQTTETRGMGCNWGPGISGGPWLIAYAPPLVSGFADGVNSGMFVGQNNLYGPRFNSNNIVVLCNAAGC
jgi:V8-like Glu-specific endopeptidase